MYWKVIHHLKILSENYSPRHMDNNIIIYYATSLFKFLNALYAFCDKIAFFVVMHCACRYT